MSDRMGRIREAIENIKGIIEDLKDDIEGYNFDINPDDWQPSKYEIATFQIKFQKHMGESIKLDTIFELNTPDKTYFIYRGTIWEDLNQLHRYLRINWPKSTFQMTKIDEKSEKYWLDVIEESKSK